MFTIFGRSVSCLVTPKLVGLVRDSTSFNNALISSSRENLLTPIVNRLIQVRTMASTSKENRSKVQNRLALEKSPYLLQHATNPVDWFPWGEEAFEKARREDKLIFLSVGYSTCHWCHVMERESFEDDAVAALLNRHFVSVKVDREERPDVDHLYMTFVQIMVVTLELKITPRIPSSSETSGLLLTPPGTGATGLNACKYVPSKEEALEMRLCPSTLHSQHFCTRQLAIAAEVAASVMPFGAWDKLKASVGYAV